MRLLSLTLDQFRNYGSLRLDFSQRDVQFFVGENGSGKTNILESISVLSLTKSFLGLEEQDVKQWGTEFYRVRGRIRSDRGEERDLEVVSQVTPRRQKVCFRNDVRTPLSAMVGELPTVIFLPQDLSLFTGAPAERRRFLDQILCQVSPEYFLALMEYQKILKQRNSLLKACADGRAEREHLEPWNAELARKGALITLQRLELTETFLLTLTEETRALAEQWESVGIAYQRSGSTARTLGGLESDLLASFAQNTERDIILQSTTAGPHRDDWQLEADGHLLPSFASRGQQRVAVLALLFLEASYLELRRGEKPVIVLDDIFSELDDRHRERVESAFAGHQVFMTMTHLPADGGAAGKIWRVEKGKAMTSVAG